MRIIKNLILLSLFIIPVCISEMPCFIEITPAGNNALYQMNINDVVAFKITAYQKNTQTNKNLVQETNKVWWDFDKSTLIKLNSDKNSIQLKAIKSGSGKLSAVAMVNNQSCNAEITVLVNDISKK